MARPKVAGGSVKPKNDVEDEAVGLIRNTLVRRGDLPAKNLHGCLANGSVEARTFIGGTNEDVILEFVRKYPHHFKIHDKTVSLVSLPKETSQNPSQKSAFPKTTMKTNQRASESLQRSVYCLTAIEKEAVMLIKKPLIDRGPLPVKNLFGYVGNGRQAARDLIGGAREKTILDFVRKYPREFIVTGDIVHVATARQDIGPSSSQKNAVSGISGVTGGTENLLSLNTEENTPLIWKDTDGATSESCMSISEFYESYSDSCDNVSECSDNTSECRTSTLSSATAAGCRPEEFASISHKGSAPANFAGPEEPLLVTTGTVVRLFPTHGFISPGGDPTNTRQNIYFTANSCRFIQETSEFQQNVVLGGKLSVVATVGPSTATAKWRAVAVEKLASNEEGLKPCQKSTRLAATGKITKIDGVFGFLECDGDIGVVCFTCSACNLPSGTPLCKYFSAGQKVGFTAYPKCATYHCTTKAEWFATSVCTIPDETGNLQTRKGNNEEKKQEALQTVSTWEELGKQPPPGCDRIPVRCARGKVHSVTPSFGIVDCGPEVGMVYFNNSCLERLSMTSLSLVDIFPKQSPVEVLYKEGPKGAKYAWCAVSLMLVSDTSSTAPISKQSDGSTSTNESDTVTACHLSSAAEHNENKTYANAVKTIQRNNEPCEKRPPAATISLDAKASDYQVSTDIEAKAIEVILVALDKRGPLPVKNMYGYVVSAERAVMKYIGNSDDSILKFVKARPKYFTIQHRENAQVIYPTNYCQVPTNKVAKKISQGVQGPKDKDLTIKLAMPVAKPGTMPKENEETRSRQLSQGNKDMIKISNDTPEEKVEEAAEAEDMNADINIPVAPPVPLSKGNDENMCTCSKQLPDGNKGTKPISQAIHGPKFGEGANDEETTVEIAKSVVKPEQISNESEDTTGPCDRLRLRLDDKSDLESKAIELLLLTIDKHGPLPVKNVFGVLAPEQCGVLMHIGKSHEDIVNFAKQRSEHLIVVGEGDKAVIQWSPSFKQSVAAKIQKGTCKVGTPPGFRISEKPNETGFRPSAWSELAKTKIIPTWLGAYSGSHDAGDTNGGESHNVPS